MNVLKSHLRITIQTLRAHGVSQHEIARRAGVDRKTIRRYHRRMAPGDPINVLSLLGEWGYTYRPATPPNYDDGLVFVNRG